MRDRGLRYWLPSYAAQAIRRRRLRKARAERTTHLLFLVCDHFEPRHGIKEERQAQARLDAWHAGFRGLQEECLARFGLRPLHTWFYPPHHGREHLPALARMAFDGLGEVELHYHHDGDSPETLRRDLRRTIEDFHRAGLLLQLGSPPVGRFGFIHGDWALDNSCGGRFCGVNGELSILQELGCWGDLTMPSSNECQTRKINSIYYAVDDPRRPKSHDRGVDAAVGLPDQPGLLLIQGPLALYRDGRGRPRFENASLTSDNWGTAERIRQWIDCHVHVAGRPEWLFIKLHTHGAIERDFDALFGERALRMHRVLAESYNDGKRFKLHYVTARQAFNVIRAAESNAQGDPGQFLDWELPAQVTSRYCASVPHRVECCTPDRLVLDDIAEGPCPLVRLRNCGVEEISGALARLDVSMNHCALTLSQRPGAAQVRVRLARGHGVRAVDGARIVSNGPDLCLEGAGEVRIQLAPDSRLEFAG